MQTDQLKQYHVQENKQNFCLNILLITYAV